MRDTAIRNVHTSVATINAETTAWDDSGNIVVLDEAAIATEIARLVIQADADAIAKQNRLDSVKSKLEALGLTTEEVQEAFGL